MKKFSQIIICIFLTAVDLQVFASTFDPCPLAEAKNCLTEAVNDVEKLESCKSDLDNFVCSTQDEKTEQEKLLSQITKSLQSPAETSVPAETSSYVWSATGAAGVFGIITVLLVVRRCIR